MSKYYKYKNYKPAEKLYQKSAIEVLQEKMEFYDSKGTSLFIALKQEMKNNGTSRGDLLVAMTKNILHCHDMAIECAHKLAPYRNPKLQSIEVKKETIHRFVIQAPKIIKDSQEWLQSVNSESKLINGSKELQKIE